jgi:hypothetical protein
MAIKFGDKEYALVPDRLKRFREENPRAKIDSNPTYNVDGSITFKTVIVKDQADPHSAIGSGNARYTETELKKPKAFEKLETISKGRALADIGYLNDGQVATTEELEEFYEYKHEKYQEQIENATSVPELVQLFNSMNGDEKKEFTELLSNKKKELSNASKS